MDKNIFFKNAYVESLKFPTIHYDSDITIYIQIIKNLFDAGYSFAKKNKFREAYILHLRCVTICIEHLPKHKSYKTYNKIIKDYSNSSLNALENIKKIIENYFDKLSDRTTIAKTISDYKLVEYDVPADGNCQFHAISDQLMYRKNINIDHKDIRKLIALFLNDNGFRDMDDGKIGDKVNFMQASGFLSKSDWDNYVFGVSQTAWGDNSTLVAACALYNVDIVVLSSENYVNKISCPPVWGIKSSHTLYIIHISEYHYKSTRYL